MRLICSLRFIYAAKKESTKRTVKNRIAKKIKNELLLDVADIIEKEKDVAFHIILENIVWEVAIYRVIAIAQEFGYSWYITGGIATSLCLWSQEVSFTGVEAIDICLDNIDEPISQI